MGWDYTKIQEPCFVCDVEDKLNQERGTQSHPINCGWRVNRERSAYIEALENIYNLVSNPKEDELKDIVKRVKDLTVKTIVHRHDIADNDKKEKKYYFITVIAEGDTLTNAVISDKHPMKWQMEVNKEYPGMYVLLNWKEISEEDRLIYLLGGVSDGNEYSSGNSESMDS